MADLASNLNPSRVRNITDSFNTEVVKFENGAEQRFANQHTRDTEYELTWTLIDSTDMESLRTFFNIQMGQRNTWTINDSRLGAGDLTVRFTEDKLKVESVNYTFFNVKIKIKLM